MSVDWLPTRRTTDSFSRLPTIEILFYPMESPNASESELNEYERAFVDHMARSGIAGLDFARLTKEVFEAEIGGEGDALLKGLSQPALEDPGLFASELYKTFGLGALQYYVMIVKYVDAGKFHPEEEAKEEAEEEDLESIFNEIGSDPEQETESSSPP